MRKLLELVREEIVNWRVKDPRCARCHWRIRSIYPGHLCFECYQSERNEAA